VEVNGTWIGGTQAGLRGSRQLKGRKAALVLVAVEKRSRGTGRARTAVIPDFKNATLLAFLKENVALFVSELGQFSATFIVQLRRRPA
jgi:ISXO2-like transposase domain